MVETPFRLLTISLDLLNILILVQVLNLLVQGLNILIHGLIILCEDIETLQMLLHVLWSQQGPKSLDFFRIPQNPDPPHLKKQK